MANPLLVRPDEDVFGGLLAGMTPKEAGGLAKSGVEYAGGLLDNIASSASRVAEKAPGSLGRAWQSSDFRRKAQEAIDTASYYAGPHLSDRAAAIPAAAAAATENLFGNKDAREASAAFREGKVGQGAKLLGLGSASALLDVPTLGTGGGMARGLLRGLTKAAHYTPDLSAAIIPGARSLFDKSMLSKVPDVPQFDLPRNIPARGVSARVQDITSDPGVRSKMLETIEEGRAMGGADWYNADPLRERFLSELGKEKGPEDFRKFMDFVAATSPRSDVGTNVRNASYYYQRYKSGQGMPAVGDRNPAPYGHMAQRLHQMNAERVAGAGWDPLNNPKPASFVENLVGNQRPGTIDTHAFRLPAMLGKDPRFLATAYESSKGAPKQNIQAMVNSGQMSIDDAVKTPAFWQSMPKDNEYGAMEKYYQGLGNEMGLSTGQTQASAWVGGGKLTGLASDESKPFLGFLEDRVNLTAQKTGMDPEEVLRRFIRGEGRLLALPLAASGVAAGGLVGSLPQNQ
jgi:hypothetical protein